MASRQVVERVLLKTLQRHHHSLLNTFSDHETLVDAVANRPGLVGPNPVSYLSLLARRPTIRLGDLEEALINDRTLLRASAFRGSLSLVSTTDFPLYFRAMYPLLQNKGMKALEHEGISRAHFQRFAEIIEESLSFVLPLSASEIIDGIFPGRTKRPSPEICQRIIYKMCDMGVLVRANAKGWKGNDFKFSLMKKWVPELILRIDNPEAARTETIRRYLRCYGPASVEDIACFTGLPVLQCQRSVSHLRREAVRFHVEGYKEDLVGLRETVEIIRKKAPLENEIQLLPPWDPFTNGWSCKKRLIDKEYAPYVFDTNKNATSVIVDSGKIIGLWQFRDGDVNCLEFHIFESYLNRKKEVSRKLDEYAKELAVLSGYQYANIYECPLPKPLNERDKGAFIWPLGKSIAHLKINTQSPMERRTSNTFRGKYLDSSYLVRPSGPLPTFETDVNEYAELAVP